MRTTAIALALLAAALAAPAGAGAARIGGLVADVGSHATAARSGLQLHTARAARDGRLPYDGGPVLQANRTHLIFWQPSGSGLGFEPRYGSTIERFLANVAADSRTTTNVYGLSGQYYDQFGPAAYSSSYGGAVLDQDPLPPSECAEPPATGPGWTVCLTDQQLQSELGRVVWANHLPTTDTDVYFLVTPNGFGSCTDSSSSSCALGGSANGYCGYHSETGDQLLFYAVIPYNAVAGHCQSDNPRPNASTADPTISTISHEHNEAVTDPLGNGWIDQSGNEEADLCITNFGPAVGGYGAGAWNEVVHGGRYYLQEEWSNEDGSCQPRARPDWASFRPPAHAQARKRVKFTAFAHAGHGSIVAYNWFFAGSWTRGRSVTHAFKRPGSYRVVLRVTDSAGNWAYYSRVMRVGRAPAKR